MSRLGLFVAAAVCLVGGGVLISENSTNSNSVNPVSPAEVASETKLVVKTESEAEPVSDVSADDSSAEKSTEDKSTEDTETQSETESQSGTQPDSLMNNRGAKPEVELRLSSEAQLAKGEINFDDLKFDIEKDAPFDVSMWTTRLKRINEKNVKLRGYILPSSVYQNEGFKQFVLVRDNQECCFGPGAALFDCVMVTMVDGNTADFTTRPVTVEGKFILDAETYKYPGGKGPRGATHMAIFRIEGVNVK